MKHQSSIITGDLNAVQTNWLKRKLMEYLGNLREFKGNLAGGEIENLTTTADNIIQYKISLLILKATLFLALI